MNLNISSHHSFFNKKGLIKLENSAIKELIDNANLMQSNQETTVVVPTTSTENDSSNIIKNDDGSYTIFEYDSEGNLLGAEYYSAEGTLQETRKYNENGYSANYYSNGIMTTYVEVDKQGRPGHQIDYNEDGSIVRIWDNEYRDDGTHVVVCKKPNGELISVDETDSLGNGVRAERYENGVLKTVIETNYFDDGSSRQIHKNATGEIEWIIAWNADNQTTKNITKDDSKFLNELKNLLDEYNNDILTIQSYISGLVIPNAPILTDFKKSDGSGYDEEAYQVAYDRYQEECAIYDEKKDILEKERLELTNKIQALNTQISKLLNEKITNLGESIDALNESPNSNKDLVTALQNQLAQVSITSDEEYTELYNELESIIEQLNSLTIPTPPVISDFYKEDGSVDDEAYKEAMNNYEYDLYLYDRSVAELNAKASIIQNEIRNKKLDDSQAQRKLELIEKNIKTVQDIQRQLDSLENTPENQAQIAELKQRLEIAEENIKSQIDIQSKIDTLSNQIITKEAPTPPSTSDYLKEDGTVDSEAYSKAYEAYKKACADYDKEQERLNEEMQALFKELNKLIYQMNMLANGQKPRRIPLVARNFEIKQLNLQYMNLLYRN